MKHAMKITLTALATLGLTACGAETSDEMDHSTMDHSKMDEGKICLLYTSPSPRDQRGSRMPSSA